MSLKRIISFALAATMTLATLSTVSVSAADNVPTFTIQKPVGLTDGKALETLKGADVIAVPVDVDMSATPYTGFRNMTFNVKYDRDYLEIASLDIMALLSSWQGPQGIANGFHSFTDKTNYYGFKMVTGGETDYNEREPGLITVLTTDANEMALVDGPEIYLFFKVKADAPADIDSALNLINIDFSKLSYDPRDTSSVYPDIKGDEGATGGCAGAFKVTIDGSKVPTNTWIRQVYAQQDGHDAVELQAVSGDGDQDTYVFPTRVQIGAGSSLKIGDNATFKILADVSTTKDGAITSPQQEIGTVQVQLNDTVKDYADTPVSIN